MSQTAAQKIVACILVRMKSARLPRKALLDLHGKPTLRWIVDRLRQVSRLDEIILCTSDHPDDRVLLDLAAQWGLPAVAGSQEDMVARLQQAAREREADVLIRVTGDNPLTCPVTLDRIIARHLETDADYTRMNGLPLGITTEALSVRIFPKLGTLIPTPEHSEYLLFYAFNPELFHCEVLDAAPSVYRPAYSLTVDTAAELAMMQAIFEAFSDAPTGPTVAQAVAFMDTHPEYQAVPDSQPVKVPDGRTITFAQCLEWLKTQAEKTRTPHASPASEN